jgi:hypothetical protein
LEAATAYWQTLAFATLGWVKADSRGRAWVRGSIERAVFAVGVANGALAYELIIRSMPIHEVSQLHVFIEFHYYRRPFHAVLQIPVRLAPAILVNDIGQRNTSD